MRIFQEGVKIEKGVEGSKAAERTAFRSARRIKYRRKVRKVNTLKVLSDYGYCPELDKEELKNWLYKKIYPQNELFKNWWKTDDKANKNPYYFRNLAITEKLDLSEEENRFAIGRAFYHMAQRRGFLSNRLEGTKESEGAVKKSIAEISKAKGNKTLGQYFYEKYHKGEKIRDTYTHRNEHYLEEFERISAFQELPADFVEKLRKAIFYQRPLKSQKGLIGKCVFEPNKPRCAVSRPEFEEYRMLCFLNNIKMKTPDDEKLRFLTAAEKEKVMPQFYRKSKEHFDFEDLAKQLAPKNQYKYFKARDINPEDWLLNFSMKTTVSGCPVSARLKDLFGDNFMDIRQEYTRESDGAKAFIDINDVWHVLYSFDSEEKLAGFARKRLGFNEDEVKEFLKIKLKQDYASLSLKAIRKILPYLRKGLIYSHAVFLANMEEIIPAEIWKNKANRDYIRDEIKLLIDTQNEEKQIIDIVNGSIKNARNDENSFVWSNEAEELFRNGLKKKINAHFGPKRYAGFEEEKKARIETKAFDLLKKQMQKNMGRGEFAKVHRIDDRVLTFITDNFEVDGENLSKIYHPSAIDVYKPPVKGKDGRYYLGSPMVSSIRNPMAMRAMHQLRKVINELIKEDIIDANTRIHIEMSRGLLNANERKATQNWQRENEARRKEYAAKIKEFLDGGEPSEEEILKYQLWEEQRHKCLYTGQEIRISDFLGANPRFDIEHTIPRSVSFDNSQANKTLCENAFNRSVKRNKIPSQLANHAEILERIEFWKEKYEELDKQINIAVRQSRGAQDKDSKDRAIQKRHKLAYERNYWRDKYQRFTMEDVPEGFKNSQLVDTGIITKYSRMYLKTYFDKVYTVKGNTVADFRRLWGIQDEYEKKERVNHIHHCIDAVAIACITKEQYENLAKFYHDWEDLHVQGVDHLPPVEKPWATFTEEVKAIEKEVLVSHYTPDVLPKQSKKKLRKRGKIQYNKQGEPIYQNGDTVRGSLHKETNYGAIKRPVLNKQGELEDKLVYAARKPVDSLTSADVKNIVDDAIRKIIEKGKKEEVRLKKELATAEKKLKDAEEQEEITNAQILIDSLKEQISRLYMIENKDGSFTPVKKVRCVAPMVTNPLENFKKHRDLSDKEYKQQYNVANDGNYGMAIYEGLDKRGNLKRDFVIINNLNAGKFFIGKSKENPIPELHPKTKYPFKYLLKAGMMFLLYKESKDKLPFHKNEELSKHLYKLVKMDRNGRLFFRPHIEARPAGELKEEYNYEANHYIEQLCLRVSKFNALVEGIDFKISPIGKITKL
nr:type II CRISPR RNA-guided endonuclease Cas9 [uncultured Draconibacterium sp.]